MKASWSEPPPRRSARTDEWGKFLMGAAPWTWIATLTFALGVRDERAADAWRLFVRHLARGGRDHIPVAWVIEPDANGRHVHGLVAVPPRRGLHEADLKLLARIADKLVGYSEFKEFDPTRGWTWYMAKSHDPDINVGCPMTGRCRRKGNCLVAPSPWH